MFEAIKKYKATPMISIAVVTKGPVDIAGSKLSFFRTIGTLAPTAVAIVIEQNILNPITIIVIINIGFLDNVPGQLNESFKR